jgi:hypothetical protein
MTPTEVLDRFTDSEIVHLQAYQELYGPIGDRRYDYLFARLGMDTVAPHLKKGKRTSIEDHILQWGGPSKPRQTPEEMMAVAKNITAAFEMNDKAQKARAERTKPQRARAGGRHGGPRRADGAPRRGRDNRRARGAEGR